MIILTYYPLIAYFEIPGLGSEHFFWTSKEYPLGAKVDIYRDHDHEHN